MAKTSMVEREKRRAGIVKKYAAKRAKLKELMLDSLGRELLNENAGTGARAAGGELAARVAVGALFECRRRGIKVPDDIAEAAREAGRAVWGASASEATSWAAVRRRAAAG